ncbi:MAG: ABC transporter ATP-binding protein [Treponema sp.]|nr:ABC transporter ATP-binding protein [Treponema sp.]
MAESAFLSIEHVSFSFGKTDAVHDFSLEVAPGSFTTLLGPSGCGKTTLLRLISGFLEPQSGCIKINGVDQHGIAPNLRNVGMVFQDYALFPHLTVEQNLLYGLKLKKDVDKTQWSGLIHQTARILGLSALLERYPHELSGGQQQRVALGRALVLKPCILLMDEPLSSLDAKLRTQVREELKDIQSQLGITTVYVTHDQEEALSLSDSIAVIHHGQLQQAGTAQEIYFRPKNRFVADFVGCANFIEAAASFSKKADAEIPADGTVCMARPDWLSVHPLSSDDALSGSASGAPEPVLTGTIISASFIGSCIRYRVRCASFSGGVCVVDAPTRDGMALSAGTPVSITMQKSYAME